MGASGHVKAKPLAEKAIVVRAIADSFAKLNPRTMMKNPVMFVVEVGAVLTTVELVRDTLNHTGTRSEEHTSELQSRQYLVCRLLLEKKKKRKVTNTRCRT